MIRKAKSSLAKPLFSGSCYQLNRPSLPLVCPKPGAFLFNVKDKPKAHPFQTKAPEGFPSVHDINRPQRHRCRFLQALCLIEFSF